MEVLEDLWYGRICPCEATPHRQEYYLELMELFRRSEEKLLPDLSQGQQETFQKVRDLWEEMEQVGRCSAFITGFRLAVQLMSASV